jgi:hypothetical protein
MVSLNKKKIFSEESLWRNYILTMRRTHDSLGPLIEVILKP